jgi:hypothetical protein
MAIFDQDLVLNESVALGWRHMILDEVVDSGFVVCANDGQYAEEVFIQAIEMNSMRYGRIAIGNGIAVLLKCGDEEGMKATISCTVMAHTGHLL